MSRLPPGAPGSDPRLPFKKPPAFYHSFAAALSGVGLAFVRERNLRIQLTAGAAAVWLARYFAFSPARWAILALAIGFVLSCELINTAIEHLVDIVSPARNALAGASKDVAAGAVLVSAFTGVAVGLLLFWDKGALSRAFSDVISNPVASAAALATALIWIILPGRRRS